MKRIAAALALVFLSSPLLAAEPLKVLIITDPEPDLATQHGLEQLRAVLEAKGVQVASASTPAVYPADLMVAAGLIHGKGVATNFFSRINLMDPTTPESFRISRTGLSQHDFGIGPKSPARPVVLVGSIDDRGLMY